LYESEQRDSYLLSSVANGGAADPTVRTVSNQDQPLTYEYMVFLLSNEGKCACFTMPAFLIVFYTHCVSARILLLEIHSSRDSQRTDCAGGRCVCRFPTLVYTLSDSKIYHVIIYFVLLSNVWLTEAAPSPQASAARSVSSKATVAKKNPLNSHLDAPELERSARRARNKSDRAFVYFINIIDYIFIR
jgi:hypothetical protein